MLSKLLSLFLPSPKRWALNCDFHNWTVQDLSLREAQIILETLRDSEKATVLVWRTGWPTWRSLKHPSCSELMYTRIQNIEAPHLNINIENDSEITAVRPMSNESPFQARKYKRFSAAYPCLVLSNQKEFATQTVDLSRGGIRLANSVPDWVAGYCTLRLEVESGVSLSVICALAEDQKDFKTRFEVVSNEGDVPTEYTKWFDAQEQFK